MNSVCCSACANFCGGILAVLIIIIGIGLASLFPLSLGLYAGSYFTGSTNEKLKEIYIIMMITGAVIYAIAFIIFLIVIFINIYNQIAEEQFQQKVQQNLNERRRQQELHNVYHSRYTMNREPKQTNELTGPTTEMTVPKNSDVVVNVGNPKI